MSDADYEPTDEELGKRTRTSFDRDKGIDGYGTVVNNFNSVNDSGKRESFDTGSVRDTRDGKGRFDLIPIGPLRRLAKHYENGARKYGDRNWEKGQPSSRYYDSAMRHLTNYMAGDRTEDHLAAVMWNAAAMAWNEERRPDLDDITPLPEPDLVKSEAAEESDITPRLCVCGKWYIKVEGVDVHINADWSDLNHPIEEFQPPSGSTEYSGRLIRFFKRDS